MPSSASPRRPNIPTPMPAPMRSSAKQKEEEKPEDVTAVTSEPSESLAQRRADALTTMAETTLRHGPGPLSSAERYQVVVHVTAETLAEGDDGRAELECGQRIAPDTVRRIACDASLLRITEDGAGNPLDIGRRSRAVPPAIQRALRSRDGGCRFPGCTCRRFVDAHHIRHWANGGETSLDNLVLLCRRHHRLVHEGGFDVERTPDGTLRFTRPDGRVIDEHPQLPKGGGFHGFHDSISGKGNPPIDASNWVIPEGVMDLDLTVSGLMQRGETQTIRVERPS